MLLFSEMGIQEDDPYGLNFTQDQQDHALTFQDIGKTEDEEIDSRGKLGPSFLILTSSLQIVQGWWKGEWIGCSIFGEKVSKSPLKFPST